MQNNPDTIIVLDFGSQYNQLICRRIREMKVYSLLLPYSTTAEELKKYPSLRGIILSGGPNSVYEEGSFRIDEKIFSLGVPVLGICYGMQLISHLNKGEIIPGIRKEYGGQEIEVLNDSLLYNQTPKKQIVWMSQVILNTLQLKILINKFMEFNSILKLEIQFMEIIF